MMYVLDLMSVRQQVKYGVCVLVDRMENGRVKRITTIRGIEKSCR